MDVQYHVAVGAANGRVQVRGSIIEKPQGFVVCFVGDLGLGCIDGTKGNDNGDVNGDCVAEDSTNNMLNKADVLWRKRRGVVNIFRVLDFGAIGGLRPGVGEILSAFGVGMLKLVQCFVDVAWHRDVDSPVGVVPHNG